MAGIADVLAGLRDIHLPAVSEAGAFADGAVAFSAGLAAAFIVAMLARAVAKRPPSRRNAARADLASARGLEPAERILVQATVLRRIATDLGTGTGPEADRGDWFADLDRRLGSDFFTAGAGAGLRDSLYRREVVVDPDLLDRELLRLLKRVKG